MLDRTDDLSVIASLQADAFGISSEEMLARLRTGRYPALVAGHRVQVAPHDGYWDGLGGRNRQCFVLPGGSVSLLLRLFERRSKMLGYQAARAGAACRVSAAQREGFARSA